MLAETRNFAQIVEKEALIPVGNWDQGMTRFLLASSFASKLTNATLLAAKEETMGNLAWMDSEFFLPATKPFFISSGLPEADAQKLIADAQRDLYSADPERVRLYSCMHWVYARKA